VQVDFYQLSRDPVEVLVPEIARRTLEAGHRLLLVSADRAQLDHISAALWDSGPERFLANGHADGERPDAQPILLSADCQPACWPMACGARRLLGSSGCSFCLTAQPLQAPVRAGAHLAIRQKPSGATGDRRAESGCNGLSEGCCNAADLIHNRFAARARPILFPEQCGE
jgi:hypothetical protein